MTKEKAILKVLEDFRTYNFKDEETDFGNYFINEKNPEKIKKALEEYKKIDKYYSIEEFLEYLQNKKGYTVIATDIDYSIYF